jgi:hypothetical protein
VKPSNVIQFGTRLQAQMQSFLRGELRAKGQKVLRREVEPNGNILLHHPCGGVRIFADGNVEPLLKSDASGRVYRKP